MELAFLRLQPPGLLQRDEPRVGCVAADVPAAVEPEVVVLLAQPVQQVEHGVRGDGLLVPLAAIPPVGQAPVLAGGLIEVLPLADLRALVGRLGDVVVREGAGDGGVSQRLFATLLGWLQEKRAEVFVVATANDVFSLPPELLRKGRLDRKSTRLNSSHMSESRMPSSA